MINSSDILYFGSIIVGGLASTGFFLIKYIFTQISSIRSDIKDYQQAHDRVHMLLIKNLEGRYVAIDNHLISISEKIGKLTGSINKY